MHQEDPDIKYYIVLFSTYAPWIKEGRRRLKMQTFKGKTEREAKKAWQEYVDLIEYGKYFSFVNIYGYLDSKGELHA